MASWLLFRLYGGHVAGGGGNPEDTEWMEKEISEFLGAV